MKEYPFGVVTGRTDREIPIVHFVEDVAEFMKQPGADTKTVIEVLQDVHRDLTKIESRLSSIKASIQEAIPEIQENLEVISFLEKKRGTPVITNFQVSASLFAQAKLDTEGEPRVVQWLGASTAAELTLGEAKELLQKNLAKKQEHLEITKEDLKMVKKQITTTEVSIARVYNNDVKERRKQTQEESA